MLPATASGLTIYINGQFVRQIIDLQRQMQFSSTTILCESTCGMGWSWHCIFSTKTPVQFSIFTAIKISTFNCIFWYALEYTTREREKKVSKKSGVHFRRFYLIRLFCENPWCLCHPNSKTISAIPSSKRLMVVDPFRRSPQCGQCACEWERFGMK